MKFFLRDDVFGKHKTEILQFFTDALNGRHRVALDEQATGFNGWRGKALAVRLAERARASPSDDAPLRFLAERGRSAIQRLYRNVAPSRRGSPGNCFLADEPGIGFLRGRLQTLPPGPELTQLRHEHVISDAAFALLRAGRVEDFIDRRREDLNALEADFFEELKVSFKDALPSREG